jgi:hypothetical protein
VFPGRQARLKALEALEDRAKQFRGREEIWPFRAPHAPLNLERIVEGVPVDALRSRTVLRLEWPDAAWELWTIALPSGILLYCDSGGDESRVLASAKRGNPSEADGFFLERLAESRGEFFGIEMAGPAPDRVRASIGDRAFLADVFVELFEGTGAEHDVRASAEATDRRDFRTDVVRWLDRVLTCPPFTRRQPRIEEAER